jgi:hypothetical protein
LRNHAADALSCLAPSLDKEELRQALKAIISQHWNGEKAKVFEPTMTALWQRLAEQTK